MKRQGVVDSIGKRLRVSSPNPNPPTLAQIGHVYSCVDSCGVNWRPSEWWKCLIVVGTWTGFRRSDLLWLRWDGIDDSGINLTANKTGKNHWIPMVPCVRRHLEMLRGESPEFVFSPTRTFKQLYAGLLKLRIESGVNVTPQLLRQRSVTMWTSANAIAGQLVHGCLERSVLNHYIDRQAILRDTADQIELPAAFLNAAERKKTQRTESALLDAFRRASPSRRKTILDVARKLA